METFSKTTEGKKAAKLACWTLLYLICFICKYCKIWVNVWSAGLLGLLLTMIFSRIRQKDFVLRGQKLIDMNLEERQYSRQLYHFLNIDEENKVGGKHTVLFKSFLSLLGEPTWSQSPAEIHRICTSLKTNISLGTKALLSSRFVCEILTHQEMAPSWVSTHKNMNAKDKTAQPICPPPPHLNIAFISTTINFSYK